MKAFRTHIAHCEQQHEGIGWNGRSRPGHGDPGSRQCDLCCNRCSLPVSTAEPVGLRLA